MNYKNIFLILLVAIAVSTLCILISRPKMHKVVMIYDSSYVLAEDEQDKSGEENIPVIEQKVETVSYMTSNEVKKQEVKTPAKTTKIDEKKASISTKPAVKKEVKTEFQPKTKQLKEKMPVQAKTEKSQTERIEARPNKQTIQTTVPKILTVEQEEILWNIWRSNLQNQIMKDVRMPIIPNGVIFKFSFDVDKFGKITNLQTWSTTPQYTPYAVQFIAPVIRSYQGKSILEFPNGSARTTTKVKGGWRISNNTKYSTPNDYNDTEKVVK